MSDLKQAHEKLTAALIPLGVDVGPELLAVWLDRERHGQTPLPVAALRDLAAWAERQLAERS